MLSILVACASMALRDCLGTLLVIAEARGQALRAGCLDALGDIATVLVTATGAGAIILHGLTPHTLAVLAAMCATSLAGTTYWTKIGSRQAQRAAVETAVSPARNT